MKRKPGMMSTVYDVQVQVPIGAWKTVLSTYNLHDALIEAKYRRKHQDQTTRVSVRMVKNEEITA